MVDELVYDELVCEFLATFESHDDFVTFRLGGIDKMLSMKDLGVSFGIWIKEEIHNSPIYASIFWEFDEDFQIYWSHVALKPSPYSSIRGHASGLCPSLRYLHYILSHSITGQRESFGVINSIEVALLSHIYREIPVDLTYIFIILARDY